MLSELNTTEYTNEPKPKDALYYDSECPICSAEMDKLCQLKNDTLELIPINKINQVTQDVQSGFSEIEQNKLYDELHIRTADGRWITGYEANIYAWQQTKYAPLANWLGKPPLKWFGKLGYKVWLVWYRWQRDKKEMHHSSK